MNLAVAKTETDLIRLERFKSTQVHFLSSIRRSASLHQSFITLTDSPPLLAFSFSLVIFTLNSKRSSFTNHFLLSLFAPTSVNYPASWPNSRFLSQCHFHPCHSPSLHSCTPVSLKKPPTVIAVWHALYRHSKSRYSSSFILFILYGEIIIIFIIAIIIIIIAPRVLFSRPEPLRPNVWLNSVPATLLIQFHTIDRTGTV